MTLTRSKTNGQNDDDPSVNRSKNQCQEEQLPNNITSGATSGGLIINEVLCFLTTAWFEYPIDVIISTCENFYSNEELLEAQRLLKCLLDGNDIGRLANNGCSDDNITKDLLRKLFNAPSGSLPSFVAGDLLKIPRLPRMAAPLSSDTTALATAIQMLERKFENLVNFANAEFYKIHTSLTVLHGRQQTSRPLPPRAPPSGTALLPTHRT